MSGSLRVALALSVAGMVLLPLFGLLLRFQPKFIHGLHVDAAKAERNCYIAAGAYGVVFVTSAMVLCMRARQDAMRERGRHQAIDLHSGGKKKDVVASKKGIAVKRPDSRSSSREDTAIMLDSPLESDHVSI